jgi:Fe-S-cluster containining protein
MPSPTMEDAAAPVANGVCRVCPDPCCYGGSWHWHLPPLTAEEVRRIGDHCGDLSFLDQSEGFPVLRLAADGCCTFMDRVTRECSIYPVRPYDCQAFPFDFFPINENESMWVMWDCLLSRNFDEGEIERRLQRLEEAHAEQIRAIWHYGNDDYPITLAHGGDLHQLGDKRFRVLRKVRVLLRDAAP